jgi:photosystem II stability/assembly factor-like uncharacterized protein
VSYLDAKHGWALGDARCPTGTRTNCATLLRTVNGGQSWHRIGVPAGLVSTRDYGSCGNNGTIKGNCVDELVFATAKIGYLWSYRKMYLTTDGGKQWTDLGTERVTQVVVVGNRAVRMTTLAPCSDGCQFGVFSAPIGTTNWTKVIDYSQGGTGDWQLAGGGGVGYLLKDVGGSNTTIQRIFRSTDGTHWNRVTTGLPCSKNEIDTITVTVSGALTATCL